MAAVALLLAAGKLGIMLATLHGNISAVWPATGVAIWILIIFGRGMWPAITAAILVTEIYFAQLPMVTSGLAAVGGTVESLLGAWLWTTVRARWPEDSRDAAGCLIAALVAPVASASVGATAVWAAGVVSVSFQQLWITWWTGDAIGALALLPVLLALPAMGRAMRNATPPDAGRAALVAAAVAGVSWLSFGVIGGGTFLFSIFPVLLLAMVWFGAPGARLAALAFAVAGIAAEFAGRGPFDGGSVHGNLLNLQVFLAAVAMVAVLLPLFRTRGSMVLPVTVLLVGWTLSGWIFATLDRDRRVRREEVFNDRVAAAEAAIRVRVNSYGDALLGGASFFTASKEVDRGEWRVYVQSLQLATRYPGINGIGVIFPVRPEEQESWLARMRQDGVPDLSIKPFPATTDRPNDVKYVITYLEPAEIGRGTLGRNIATEPSRRLAAEVARDTGEPQMNRRIPGSRDMQRRAGFIFYVPLYQKGVPTTTVEERRAAHIGWVYGQFFADNFLNGVLGPMKDSLTLHFFEEGDLTREHLLYASTPAGTGEMPRFERINTMEIAGQRFHLGWQRGPKYVSDVPAQTAWVAVGFTFASLLLAGLVMSLQTTGQRARVLAVERTRELAATQVRLQGVLDGTAFAVISTSPEGIIEVFNAGAERMLGYTAAELVGKQTPAVIHVKEELVARAAELSVQLGRTIEPGFEASVALARLHKTDEREWTYVRKDGSRLPVLLSVTTLHGSGGEIVGFLGVAQDITVRKQVEAMREEDLARLGKLGSQVPGMIYQFRLRPDGSSCFPYASEGIRKIYRVTPEEVRDDATKVFAVLHPDDVAAVRESILHSARTLQPWQHEYRVRYADGIERWLQGSSMPGREADGSVLWHGFITDITERKEAELAFRASVREVNELKTALDAHALVAVTDLQGTILHVNERFCAVSKYPARELIGQNPRLLNSKAHPAEFFQKMWTTIARGEVWRGEMRNRAKDGSDYWVSSAVVPSLDEAGRPAHYVAIQIDITERKRLEESLALARDQALEASRLKSEFLATISHEIRTPMNAVIGMAGLLADTPLNAEQGEMVRTLTGGAENLLTIINDILDLSRIEAGRMRLDPADFDFRRVVEETAALLAPRAHEKLVELTCDFESAPASVVLGDSGRVRQVLTNLIGNAIKFTDAGEVSVRVAIVSETAQRTRLRVSVRDTGVGIPREAQARLFQPFTQADGSATRRFGGTGLGLAISRQLVELMGGEIGFESEPEKGSLFWFELEFTRGGVPAEQPTLQIPPGRRILVVDDNATNRRIVIGQLSQWGVHVEAVADGPSALARLRDAAGGPWHLVLLDWHMPGMNGLDLAVAIRADPKLARVPLVMLSSAGPQADFHGASSVGLAAFLTKPVTARQLARCIAREIAGSLPPFPELPKAGPVSAPNGGGWRLLVAEDNPANQRVAAMLLAKMGYSVEIAANGQLALARLAEREFDAVLMDCQMPVLDGYESTRRIRAGLLVGVNARLPIIALTASARAEDRAQCLEAGMNDFVTKPIRPAEIRAALERCGLRHRGSASAPAAPSEPEVVLDAEIVQTTRELPGVESASLLPELVRLYLNDEAERLPRLQQLAADRQGATLGDEAHSFGGNAASFGGMQVRRVALELERAARAGDWPAVGAQLPQLREACDRLRSEIAQLNLQS